MQKFKVGDRVRVRQWDDMVKEFGTIGFGIETPRRFLEEMAELCGETGVIVGIHEKSDGTQELRINWDNDVDGNDRKRWNYDNGMFELIVKPITPLRTTPKIVITTDGKTTTAKLYNNKSLCKTAIAKCSPEDKFDFNIGAQLAMERLMEAVGLVINEGDRVRIADSVKSTGLYETYSSWIERNAPEYAILYAYDSGLEKVDLRCDYFVLKKVDGVCLISISPDPTSFERPCYLIGEEHLRKVSK